jgi:hypothetical protein
MSTQERKPIETYVDMAGYRFERYAEWHLQGKECDDDLLKALGDGSGPRELFKQVLARFQEEVSTSDGSVSLSKIVQDLDKPLRNKPIGNLESLPLENQEADGCYLDERLKLQRPRRHEDGLIIYFQTMLYNEHGHVATRVCKLLIEISKTKIVLVVPAPYPEASIGTPVPSILSIKIANSASASFEIQNTSAELASLISRRSKLKELLDSIDQRIQQMQTGLSVHSTGSSNNAAVAAAQESLTEWTEI